MTIWIIIWSDGYDSGNCFCEAFDSEAAAEKRLAEVQNERQEYSIEEYELNTFQIGIS